MRYILLAHFICAIFAITAFGDDELLIKTYTVTVISDIPTMTADQPLRVFKVVDGPLALEPMPTDAKFDDDGKCSVDLPAGTYRFEVLSSDLMQMLVAVHTPPVVVKGATAVKLKSADLGEVAIHADRDALEVMELAVRSISPAGEDMQMSGFSARIHLIANPDEVYSCRFVAKTSDESQTYVGWEPLKSSPNPKITIRKSQYNICTIGTKKELPVAGTITAKLFFPSNDMDWVADEKHKLLTNRDFITLSYQLATDDGQTLAFLPIGYALQKTTNIKLGGKLKASGYADAVLTKEGDGEGNRLFWVVSLTDPDGHVVDEKNSGFNLKTMASLDNAEWTTDSPYHGVDAGKLNHLNTRLRLRITSDLPDFKDVPVTPGPFVTISDRKYSLRIPGSWAFRGHVYLSKLERLNAASRAATGRPGPVQVDINWRINFNDAWAIVGSPQGGGRGLWMSMQVNGLAVDDVFEEPWAMTHEMMHTFGYNHGPEMNKQIGRALYLFNLGRWQAWDNRAFVP